MSIFIYLGSDGNWSDTDQTRGLSTKTEVGTDHTHINLYKTTLWTDFDLVGRNTFVKGFFDILNYV